MSDSRHRLQTNFKLFTTVSILTGDGRFTDLERAPGGFGARRFLNTSGLLPKFGNAGQVAFFRLQQFFQASQTVIGEYLGLLAGNSWNCYQSIDSLGAFLFK